MGDGRRGNVRWRGSVVFWRALLDVQYLVLLFYVAVKNKRLTWLIRENTLSNTNFYKERKKRGKTYI